MRSRHAVVLLLMLLSTLMLSCSDDTGVQSAADVRAGGELTAIGEQTRAGSHGTDEGFNDRRPRAAGVETFPNTLGSSWTYRVTDTVSGVVSEVTITISDTLSLYGSIPVAMWVYERDGVFEKVEFVNITGNTVNFYRDDPFAVVVQPFRKLVFPIEVGNFWDYMFGREVEYYSIPAAPAVSVPAGEFDTYQILANHRSGMLDLVDLTTLYFSPNTGFVKIDHTVGWRQTISSYEVWVLTDFAVVE